MATIRANGTDFEYIEKGRGEPVVLVHGSLGTYQGWQLQLDDFSARYRVISYSRRYHRPNACRGDETDYSAVLHADDLAAIIAEFGWDSAHVVGQSYGAYTALFLADRHTARVRSLVLGEPPMIPLLEDHDEGSELRKAFLTNVWNPAGEILARGDMEEGVRRFVDGVVEEGRFDSFPPEFQQDILENACEFKVETASNNFWTAFACRDADRIETPTLLLSGTETRRMYELIVDELARCLPNAERRKIPDSAHGLPWMNPEAYNETVMEFLGRQTA